MSRVRSSSRRAAGAIAERGRVPKGVRTGGQFAAEHRAEPELRLSHRELAAPLPYPVGSRARVNGQMGTITAEPDAKDILQIRLDDGWTVHTKSRDVVPWDAYLESVMPAISRPIHPDQEHVEPAAADRMLRASLTTFRNGTGQGDNYRTGAGDAALEVAAALLDRDADQEGILAGARGLRALADDSPASLDREAARAMQAMPLTTVRARQLAGHFTRAAAELARELNSTAVDNWTPQQWGSQGRVNTYAAAVVAFSDGLQDLGSSGRYRDPESRFLRMLQEGEDNPDTIIGEIWDEGAW